jgi:hypothetical protein
MASLHEWLSQGRFVEFFPDLRGGNAGAMRNCCVLQNRPVHETHQKT